MSIGKLFAVVILGIAVVMIMTAAITLLAPYLAAAAVIGVILMSLLKARPPDTSDDEPHKPP